MGSLQLLYHKTHNEKKTMTHQPPSNEAVEAAIKWLQGHTKTVTGEQLEMLHNYYGKPSMGASWNAARILAAEVERLRAQADERETKLAKALARVLDDWKEGYKHTETPDVYADALSALDQHILAWKL